MINTILASLPALPSTGPTADFYQQWATYLQPAPRVFVIMYAWVMHGLAMLAYWLADGVYTAWNSGWKLIDFSSIFTASDGKTDITNGFNLIRLIPIFLTLGLVIMSLMMAISLLQFIITNGERGKEWPRGLIITFFIIGLMPTLLTGGMKIAQAANETVMSTNGQQNVLIQLWKNNSVDLNSAAHSNFDPGSAGVANKYSPLVDANTQQAYSDEQSAKIISNSAFVTSTMSDDDSLKGLTDNQKKVFQNQAPLHGDGIVPLTKGSWVTGGAFDSVYPRIRVNWVGLIGGLLVFAVTGAIAIYQMLLRVWRLAYYTLTILYFAFRDLSGKKSMQILHLIEGSITGIALLPVGLILFFSWVSYSIPRISHMNLGWWPFTILSVAAMLAGARGLMTGFQLVDEWTGMPSGQGAGMLQAINTAANTMNAMRNLTSGAGARRAQMEAQRDSARETANKLADKSNLQKLGDIAGRMNGLKENAKDIPGATLKAMGDKLSDGVQSKVDDLKKGYQEGKDGVDGFINRHSNSDSATPSSGAAAGTSEADTGTSSGIIGSAAPSSAHANLTPGSQNGVPIKSVEPNSASISSSSDSAATNGPRPSGTTQVPLSGSNGGNSVATSSRTGSNSSSSFAPSSQGGLKEIQNTTHVTPGPNNGGALAPTHEGDGQNNVSDSGFEKTPELDAPVPDDNYFDSEIGNSQISSTDFEFEVPDQPLEFHAFSQNHTDDKI